MTKLEGTQATEALMPRLGCYFVFSIDAAATLESLGDREATRAAKKMSNKKYLGYANNPVSVFDLSARYHSYEIRLAKRGMPSPNVDEFLGSDMCIPILPAPEHPLGRTPMTPSKPLPWDDCYHPSFFCTTTVRVRQRYTKFRAAAELPMKELTRHERTMRDDQLRRRDLRLAYANSHPTPPAPPAPPALDAEPDAVSFVGSNHSQEELRLETPVTATIAPEVLETVDVAAPLDNVAELQEHVNDALNTPRDGIADFFAAVIELTRPPDTMVVVEMTYDLWSIKNIADPEEFFKEMAYLEQLEKESKARAIERARRIDEEFFSSKSRGRSSVAGKVARARLQITDTLGRLTGPARSFIKRLSCSKVTLESSTCCTTPS